MTKAAIAYLTWCLAVEWGRHGITVNAVAPTFIRTPGTTYALTFGVIEGSHERASQGRTIRIFMQPDSAPHTSTDQVRSGLTSISNRANRRSVSADVSYC
jgi:NAD(P)-dependent dehydrogenase (short-subunit alcohol dehydrogenase family)